MLRTAYRDDYLFYAHHCVESVEENTSLSSITESHTLIYCSAGALSAAVEGIHYDINPGDLLIVRALEVHRIIPVEFPTEFHHIQFNCHFFNVLDEDSRMLRPYNERELGMGCKFPAASLDGELIDGLFRNISRISDVYMRRIAAAGMLTILISEINRVYDCDPPRSEDTRSELIRHVVSHVSEHLPDELTPDSIAAALYISRSQLDRTFKQAFGFTLWKYITFKRLIRARHLLHAGMASNEVAKQCGFGDYSTFYKVYTKVFLTSPSASQTSASGDPLLKKFYRHNLSCTKLERPAEQMQMYRNSDKLTL